MDDLVATAQELVTAYIVDDHAGRTGDAISLLADQLAARHGTRASYDPDVYVPEVGDRFTDALVRVVNEYIVDDELSADAVGDVNDLLPTVGGITVHQRDEEISA